MYAGGTRHPPPLTPSLAQCCVPGGSESSCVIWIHSIPGLCPRLRVCVPSLVQHVSKGLPLGSLPCPLFYDLQVYRNKYGSALYTITWHRLQTALAQMLPPGVIATGHEFQTYQEAEDSVTVHFADAAPVQCQVCATCLVTTGDPGGPLHLISTRTNLRERRTSHSTAVTNQRAGQPLSS